MRNFDELDDKILTRLIKDAHLSIPKLSKKIQANPSVVYSRIKRLSKRGLIKRFTVDVNEELLGYSVSAIIGLEVDHKLGKSVFEELLMLDEVRKVSDVTGRFDLIADVRMRSLDELHDFISSKLGKIEGILQTETFIVMNRNKK